MTGTGFQPAINRLARLAGRFAASRLEAGGPG
jgi:hypothetical protein